MSEAPLLPALEGLVNYCVEAALVRDADTYAHAIHEGCLCLSLARSTHSDVERVHVAIASRVRSRTRLNAAEAGAALLYVEGLVQAWRHFLLAQSQPSSNPCA